MQGLSCPPPPPPSAGPRGHKRYIHGATEEGSRTGIDRVSPGLPWFTAGITSRITPRNKNLYDLTSLSIHFIPPARAPTSISYVYNNGVTATASTPSPVFPSTLLPRHVSFCEIIYGRKGELWDTISIYGPKNSHRALRGATEPLLFESATDLDPCTRFLDT